MLVLVNFCVILSGCQRSDRQDSEALKQSPGKNSTSEAARKRPANTADESETEGSHPPVGSERLDQETLPTAEEQQARLYQQMKEMGTLDFPWHDGVRKTVPPIDESYTTPWVEVKRDGLQEPLGENASTEERMEAIQDTLTAEDWEGIIGIHPKMAEVLVEGMDMLSAAKYLVKLGHESAADEYIERAVTENPGDFDALLLKTQRTEDNTEREAGYRYLLEMAPDSVEVLYGLGGVLKDHNPEEAIVHLQKAVKLSPENPDAYAQLSRSYRVTGQLTKALAAAEKAYQIMPNWLTEAEVRVTKWLIEKERNQPSDVQAEGTKTSVKQVLDGSSPSPEKTEPPVRETTADERSTFSPPASRSDKRRAEARQAMEAEFEKLLAEYERMIRGDSSPDGVVNQQISDLKRSIESSPNRSDSYLELGRAYEKAGEDKKAAEVYRQARKRFPKDKRFQRTLKDGSRTKRRSESNRSGRARPPQRSDQDKDPRSEGKR